MNTDNSPTNDTPDVGDPLRSPMTSTAEGDVNSFDTLDSGSSSRATQSAAVLLLVALIGGGSILGMRQFGLGSGYRYDDITIDYPIDAQTVSDEDSYTQIISDLTNHDVPHVPLSDLREEPFRLNGAQQEVEEFQPVAFESAEEREARERAQREIFVQREFVKLKLNSVIGGSMPIARVSGQAVRPGDTISDIFTVVEIHGRSVVLDAEGQRYTLTMSGN